MFDPYVRKARWQDYERDDGDTIRMVIDLGYRVFSDSAIRLLGVNTPEVNSKDPVEREAGLAAKEWSKEWFRAHEQHANKDWPFLVRSEKDKKSFDRWIGSIYCESCHSNLSEELIANGIGKEYK